MGAQAMIGHYVEDDELDAFSLVGLIKGENNLALTVSPSLNDLADWVQPSDVDFILLDINRPDTYSLEKDVAKIRESSRAPVIFITGDEAKYYRERAVTAGAQAVIEKNNLTLESLQDVLKNVVAETATPISASDIIEQELIEESNEAPRNAINTERMEAMFAYIREVLGAMAVSQADEVILKESLAMLARASSGFNTYFSDVVPDDGALPRQRSFPRIVRGIQKAALSKADERGVKLVFQMETGVLKDLVDIEKMQLGIRHFLHSVIVGAPKNSTVSFACTPTSQGLRLTASASEPFGFSEKHIMQRRLPDAPEQFQATLSMTLATMLLGLRKEDFSIFSRGSLHNIIVDIPNG